jgi:hypothetical protein
VSDEYPHSGGEDPAGARDSEAADTRARLVFAGALAAALVAIVVAILLIGSLGDSDSPDVEPAPAACVDGWNEDRRAMRFGVHNVSAHQYDDVQVTYLTKEAEPADAQTGLCAVIFGRATLDPEPIAAGQVLLPNGRWLPISIRLGVDDRRLQQLQVDALQGANAELQEDGMIIAVDA